MKNPFKYIESDMVDRIIDESFKRAATAAAREKYEGNVVEKARQKEGLRIKKVGCLVSDRLKAVAGSFPDMEKMPEIYRELVEAVVGEAKLRRAVKNIKLMSNQVKQMQINYLDRLKKSRHTYDSRETRKIFYGRTAGCLEKIEGELELIYEIAPLLRTFPDLEEAPTVIIAGLPNVGKTSLLKQLTGSEPEIQPYPFTTKGLMLGYVSFGHQRVQLIDTPGLLDRPVAKRNKIELQAIAAIKVMADLIVYVFDVSETCGYTLERQRNLYEDIRKDFKKPIIAVANKTDAVGGRSPQDTGVEGIIEVSCESGAGVEALRKFLKGELQKIKKVV